MATRKLPAKKKAKKAAPRKHVLAYDLGGTKVAVGIVDDTGKILEEKRVAVKMQEGKDAVIDQLIELGHSLLKKYPKASSIGIGSAGPLDAVRGYLLSPSNFLSPKEPQGWGEVPFTRILGKALKRPAFLDNDAAAALLAEQWKGAAKNCDNAMILTLGTGLGTAVLANGELLRGGRNLHTEAGHMVIKEGDTSAPCACGNLGCAEAYLSGKNFTLRAQKKLGNQNLDAASIAELARRGDPGALAMFDEYARMMAVTLQNFVAIFSPQVVIFTGSFAKTSDLFLEQTSRQLEKMIERRRVGIDLMPVLKVSPLNNEAGLLGGAYVAFRATK